MTVFSFHTYTGVKKPPGYSLFCFFETFRTEILLASAIDEWTDSYDFGFHLPLTVPFVDLNRSLIALQYILLYLNELKKQTNLDRC